MPEKLIPVQFDKNLKLNHSYNMDVESAYVITIDGHADSERLAERCLQSCREQQMPAKKWSAFDGTQGVIKTPQALEGQEWLQWVKLVDPYLSQTEVACALSHMSLWAYCIKIDRPIVVLEHDAIMLTSVQTHPVYGCIVYLGCIEQVKSGWPVLPTPPHATHGPNYHFICRAHAYGIDPAVAKLLLSYVIRHGICESLDLMLRADLFPIVQLGLVAYDNPEGQTTITQRKRDPFGSER
jgi:hypothetical protein